MADGQANAVKERAIAYNKLAATAFKRIADAPADEMVEAMCNHEAGAAAQEGDVDAAGATAQEGEHEMLRYQ